MKCHLAASTLCPSSFLLSSSSPSLPPRAVSHFTGNQGRATFPGADQQARNFLVSAIPPQLGCPCLLLLDAPDTREARDALDSRML